MSVIPPEHCPTCGAQLTERKFDGRTRKYCEECDDHVFHLPSASAGVAVVDSARVLLIRRKTGHRGAWAIPGGLIEWDEPPEVAAARELAEETGVEADRDDLRLATVSRAESPSGRISSITTTYAVRRARTGGTPTPSDEVLDARFWTAGELRASDHELRPGAAERITAARDAIADR